MWAVTPRNNPNAYHIGTKWSKSRPNSLAIVIWMEWSAFGLDFTCMQLIHVYTNTLCLLCHNAKPRIAHITIYFHSYWFFDYVIQVYITAIDSVFHVQRSKHIYFGNACTIEMVSSGVEIPWDRINVCHIIRICMTRTNIYNAKVLKNRIHLPLIFPVKYAQLLRVRFLFSFTFAFGWEI